MRYVASRWFVWVLGEFALVIPLLFQPIWRSPSHTHTAINSKSFSSCLWDKVLRKNLVFSSQSSPYPYLPVWLIVELQVWPLALQNLHFSLFSHTCFFTSFFLSTQLENSQSQTYFFFTSCWFYFNYHHLCILMVFTFGLYVVGHFPIVFARGSTDSCVSGPPYTQCITWIFGVL